MIHDATEHCVSVYSASASVIGENMAAELVKHHHTCIDALILALSRRPTASESEIPSN